MKKVLIISGLICIMLTACVESGTKPAPKPDRSQSSHNTSNGMNKGLEEQPTATLEEVTIDNEAVEEVKEGISGVKEEFSEKDSGASLEDAKEKFEQSSGQELPDPQLPNPELPTEDKKQ